jgi:hypothetical protein
MGTRSSNSYLAPELPGIDSLFSSQDRGEDGESAKLWGVVFKLGLQLRCNLKQKQTFTVQKRSVLTL